VAPKTIWAFGEEKIIYDHRDSNPGLS